MPPRLALARSACTAVLVLTVAATAAACESLQPPRLEEPWNEPVAGAASTTGWIEQPQPPLALAGTITPETLLSSIAERQHGTHPDGETRAQLAGRYRSGTVVAFVRTTFEDEDRQLRAIDVLLDIRGDGGGWLIAREQVRYHCAFEPAMEHCE